jgi:hypothetical protein
MERYSSIDASNDQFGALVGEPRERDGFSRDSLTGRGSGSRATRFPRRKPGFIRAAGRTRQPCGRSSNFCDRSPIPKDKEAQLLKS